MRPFQLSVSPLEGANLIEASAGTGKTYTLTGLFLRLLVEQGLRVDQILVVTYTNAATAELKERIRASLLRAKSAFKHQDRSDAQITELMDAVTDSQVAQRRIQDALIDFDRSAIFTIHGFCQRILQSYAFETGHAFQTELVHDSSVLVQQAVDDFWRRYISSAPRELATYAIEHVGSPEGLSVVLTASHHLNLKILPDDKKPSLSVISQWRKAAAEVVGQWTDVRKDIKALLEDEGLNARYYGKCEQINSQSTLTYRQMRINEICGSMDHWDGRYPVFKQFDRLTTTHLKKATKKRFDTPHHPFFDACDIALKLHGALDERMARYLQYLKIKLLQQIQPRLAVLKSQRNILFFDDLLQRVHQSLFNEHGPRLVRAVRSQYRAALVDEFQDTDPLQYQIFFKLFAKAPHLLVMIGDPKQAIYGFRGADLYAYMKAVEHADHRATLIHNWRSTPNLVDAVNTIFDSRKHSFALERIKFDRVKAAANDDRQKSSALTLWYLDAINTNDIQRPISQSEAMARIVNAVAMEIAELIASSDQKFLPEDIAILTRSHYQAKLMKSALAARNLPAVLHSAGRVFESTEANQIRQILLAASVPSDPVRVRSALSTPILGADAEAFLTHRDKSASPWHHRWTAFYDYYKTWHRHGFYRMFRQLMAREGIKARLLPLLDGDRRMTNILHLAELLHQAETVHNLGPAGLIKWLDSKCRTDETGGQDQQLRLESDSRAVRIITMHKSKGLQFKVVFCPFTWSGGKLEPSAMLFHDKDAADAPTLSLGQDFTPAQLQQAQKELLAENLRILYVALTRAQQRCYWVWGRIKGAHTSAPAYLLHGTEEPPAGQNWFAGLEKKLSDLTHKEFVGELRSLAKLSDGAMEVVEMPESTAHTKAPLHGKDHQHYSARVMHRQIASDWRVASFSSITAGQGNPQDVPIWDDRDADGTPKDIHDSVQQPVNALFNFPKGVHAGLFFHDLLEQWDPYSQKMSERRTIVADKLQTYRLDAQWIDSVDGLLMRLAQLPLRSNSESFMLHQIPTSNLINEMAFYYRLQSINADKLKHVFDKHATNPVNLDLRAVWPRVQFNALQGFLKGYIDLVLRYNSRYYIIDWKSNYLGPKYTDYMPDKLMLNMARKYYYLQYHLYTIALDQYLRNRLVGYDYQRNFGGVFYIYLRGVQKDPTDISGVFFDLPKPELVSALNRLMIAN